MKESIRITKSENKLSDNNKNIRENIGNAKN